MVTDFVLGSTIQTAAAGLSQSRIFSCTSLARSSAKELDRQIRRAVFRYPSATRSARVKPHPHESYLIATDDKPSVRTGYLASFLLLTTFSKRT
jgi:hypothetical protein